MAGCSSPQQLSGTFKPIPDFAISETNKKGVEDLSKKFSTIKKQLASIPSSYKGECPLRIVSIALTIIGVSIGIMALNGTLTALPDYLIGFLQKLTWMKAGVGVLTFTVFTSMAAILIRRVIHKTDRITQAPLGNLSGDDHWISAAYYSTTFPNWNFAGYIDISTLNEESTGKAYMYAYKDEQSHYSVSLAVTIFTPLHTIGAIAYNIIRLSVIPFFILWCMLIEKASGTAIDPTDRYYRLSDIPKEMANSLLRICRAPFYAVSIMYAALYSFFEPLNGRKLGAALERDWNEDVSRAEGFWSVRGPQSLWQFEGGRNPSGLGRNGFYLAGCWQPIAMVNYEKGQIISGTSLSKAIDPKRGKPYTIFTQATLLQHHNLLIEQYEQFRSPESLNS